MWNLLSSADFWFGAAVLGAYQIAKFREISNLDPDLATRHALIPNLQARDFAGRLAFCFALAAFLAVIFVTYFILCSVSPRILQGWAQVSGAQAGPELEKFVDSVHYPLYIAAAFIGFTQPGIPLLANIGNVQRNIFHAMLGVPRQVMTASTFFANQILARSPAAKDLTRELQLLISDAWVKQIDPYADTIFYRAQLVRLKLDNEVEVRELLKGSRRELRSLTRQLVDVASLASVRESGRGSLTRLASDLRVATQADPDFSKGFLSGGILFLIGMTLLWAVIPLFDGFAAQYLSAGAVKDFWPNDPEYSGQYLIAQAGPVLIASCMAVAKWLSVLQRSDGTSLAGVRPAPGLVANFNRYTGLFASVVIGVVVFDLLQAFFDYGFFRSGMAGDFWAFIPAKIPFYLLHSFVSLPVCFVLLLYLDDGQAHMRWPTASTLGLLALGVGLISVLYAAVRVQFNYKLPFGPNGLDMAVLIATINVAGALLAFASAALCKHQTKASPMRPSFVPSTPASGCAEPKLAIQSEPAVLASPVEAAAG
jgi:hypothetical protein